MTIMHDEDAVERPNDEQPEGVAPWWQRQPCPSWCDGGHSDVEHPDDRAHYHAADDRDVPLTLGTAELQSWGVWTPCVSVAMRQPVLEAEPRIEMLVREDTEVAMTVDEADRLAQLLAKHVRLARGTHVTP